MQRFLPRAALLAFAAAGLAACSSDGGGTTVTPPTPPPAAKFEDQFGPIGGFPSAFGQAANSEPRDVNAGDVIAVNPTAEPVNLPGT